MKWTPIYGRIRKNAWSCVLPTIRDSSKGVAQEIGMSHRIVTTKIWTIMLSFARTGWCFQVKWVHIQRPTEAFAKSEILTYSKRASNSFKFGSLRKALHSYSPTLWLWNSPFSPSLKTSVQRLPSRRLRPNCYWWTSHIGYRIHWKLYHPFETPPLHFGPFDRCGIRVKHSHQSRVNKHPQDTVYH